MAVYEQLYGAYEGVPQSAFSRFLVIPRYALRDIFKSKLVTGMFLVCFVYPLIAAILVYLRHNANAVAILQIDVLELIPLDGSFFLTFMGIQGALAFLLTVLVAPPLISRDLSNNALPLYLSRPLSRTEYVLGKGTVIAAVLSLVTWIPGLLIFFFQASLAGSGWLGRNYWIAGSIFVASAVWIVLLALIALAISAVVRWRVVASGAMLGIFFVPGAMAEIINNLFLTRYGSLISLSATINNVWAGLFFQFDRNSGTVQGTVTNPIYDKQFFNMILLEPPLWAAWAVIAVAALICVWVLSRRVRAYEVIK